MLEIIKEVGSMAYPEVSHQGVMMMFCLHFWGAVTSSIKDY